MVKDKFIAIVQLWYEKKSKRML